MTLDQAVGYALEAPEIAQWSRADVPAERDPAILQKVALLRGLPPERLEELAPMLHERSFPANTNVITAEERGEGVYAILSGTVKVYVTDAGGAEVIIAVLGPGEIVGEMSLADSLGRSASVLTLERSTLPVDGPQYPPGQHGRVARQSPATSRASSPAASGSQTPTPDPSPPSTCMAASQPRSSPSPASTERTSPKATP